MPDINKTETIAKAIVKEAIPATPAALLSPEQKLAQTMRTTADRSYAEAFTIKPIAETREISRDVINGITNRIDADIYGPAGTALHTDALNRKAAIGTTTTLLQKYIERGYSGLDPTPAPPRTPGGPAGLSERQMFQNEFMRTINRHPLMVAEYNRIAGDPAAREAFFQRYLGTQELRDNMRANFFIHEASDKKNFADVSTKRTELDAAINARTEQNDYIATHDVVNKLAQIDVDLQEHNTDPAHLGAKIQEFNNLKLLKSSPDFDTQKQTKINERDTKFRELKAARNRVEIARQRATTPDPADVAAVTALELEHAQRSAEAERYERVDEKIASLEGEKTRLENEKTALQQQQREFTTRDATVRRIEQELNALLQQRKQQEITYGQGFNTIARDTCRQFIVDEIGRLESAHTSEIQRMITDGKTHAEKALAKAMFGKYTETYKKYIWFGPELTRGNKDAIASGYSELLKNGQEKHVENLLSSQVNPETNRLYTDTEVKKLFKDKVLHDTLVEQMETQMNFRKLQTLGMTKHELAEMRLRLGPESVTKAISTYEQFKEDEKKLRSTGVLNRELVRTYAKRGLIGLVLLGSLLAGVTLAM